ncbi:aminotransferase class I/II-fold pyridoxal phosphate-dependent enzyme, partial [Flavobacteriaceae bacterium]|nr:aminotransferase class I/II-fold pyridoxal phosphate-dependent enzyme [Flavobacteriaceae bacterium]
MKDYILNIDQYKAGKFKVDGFGGVIKLSSNENALGCSPKVQEVFKNNFRDICRYPDGNSSLLKESISKKFNLNPYNIVVGSGSDEIISFICHCFLGVDDEVIHNRYGFLMYSISAKKFGAKVVLSNEKNLKIDVIDIVRKITPKTKVIFIANPNNPTGSYLNSKEVLYLLENTPKNIIIVLDLAYAEFATNDDYNSSFSLVDKYSNLIITRTFSKIHGIASLRVGYSYSSKENADYLNRV